MDFENVCNTVVNKFNFKLKLGPHQMDRLVVKRLLANDYQLIMTKRTI